MARAGRELLKRLTAPEIREIVREELAAALRPIEVKMDEMDKRLTNQLSELDKRLTGEIAGLRRELEYAPKVALLESRVAQLEKKLEAT